MTYIFANHQKPVEMWTEIGVRQMIPIAILLLAIVLGFRNRRKDRSWEVRK